MKSFVYILKSEDERYYIGSTDDLHRRLLQHKAGSTPTTHRMKNPELVFSQEFKTLQEARIIEKKIKSWKRKDFIKKIIENGFIKIA
jgi:predicted GIY-YIG superfamily endonuclease